jgi:hypothetical protein
MGGWWLGEDARRHLLDVGWVEPISVLGIAALGWRLGGPGRWSRLTAITVLLALFVGALLMGKRQAGNAFNDCVSRGEEVRRALTRYRDQHGEYPTQLSKIEARARCGRRMLRGDLLEYERRGAGYSLKFSDWLVSFSASEANPFIAQK